MPKGSRGVTHAGGPVSTVSIRVLDIPVNEIASTIGQDVSLC